MCSYTSQDKDCFCSTFCNLKDHWVNLPSAVREQDNYHVCIMEKNNMCSRSWGTDTAIFKSCCCREPMDVHQGEELQGQCTTDTAWAPASPPQLFPSLSAYKRQMYCPCHLLLCCSLQNRAAPAPQRGQAAMASLTSASESYWPDLLFPAGQTEVPSMQMQLNMIS